MLSMECWWDHLMYILDTEPATISLHNPLPHNALQQPGNGTSLPAVWALRKGKQVLPSWLEDSKADTGCDIARTRMNTHTHMEMKNESWFVSATYFFCQSLLTVCTIIKFGVNMGSRGQAWPKLLLISGLILSDHLHLNYMFKTNTALSFFSWLKMVNEQGVGGGGGGGLHKF